MSVESSALNVERSGASRAVFLSYASQDKEAARRIADALRAAGLEVWFDVSELRGGDAWDAKIRKQIKECALFVPVISANTNARPEGYFRLEWKLAVDRSHLLADDHPFLFPIAIGDVSDATARVPDKFREVQWTRLRQEETPVELAARIARLLAGDASEDRGQRTGDRKIRGAGARWSWWMIFPIVGTLTGMMFAFLPLWRAMQRPPVKPPTQAQEPKSQTPNPALSEARQLAERARAMSLQKYNSTAADYATAEGLIQKAIELDPNDAEIWAISSLFHTSIRTRGFDHAPGRRQQARAAAERATKLAPDAVQPLYALGRTQRDSDSAAAEATFKRILTLQPDHADAMSQLAYLYDINNRYDEAAALYERVLVLDPQNAPLTQYLRYLLFFHYRRFAEAEAAVKQSVALAPAANSVSGEAMLALTWRGDLDAAARALDAAPPEIRSETRMIWVGALVHLARHDPAETLRTLGRTEADYIQDNWFAGPKGMFAGLAHQMAGRHEAARVAWEAALAVVDGRLKTTPDAGALHLARGQLLAWLGQPDAARREARTLEEFGSGRYGTTWMSSSVLIYAALGDAGTGVPILEKEATVDRTKNDGWPLTAALLRTDVRWDPLRKDPRFQKLIADAEAAEIAALPPRDWPKNPELKRAMALTEGLDAIPDDLALAEQIVKPIVERAPTDLEAVTVMARIQSHYMRRGFDRSDERSTQARLYCERALQLGPDEPEALYATATYLYSRIIDGPRTERLLRRAMELDPTNPRPGRLLADLYNVTNRPEEAIAQGQENIRRFPRDVLSHYDLARNYKDQGRYEEFDRELDATLAIAPLPNAIVWKARLQFGLHNDLAGMKTWLDRVPERVRGTERAVFSYFLYAGFGGDPESGLEALRGFPQKWFTDFEYAGPTALLNASLLELQGKTELARQQYETALAEIQKMRVTDPGRIGLSSEEFWTLLGLGRRDEARTSHRRMIEGLRRPYAQYLVNGWWFSPIPGSLLLGERATALTLLRESLENVPESRAAFRLRFQIDPRMAPFRDDPEIKALLAETGEQKTGDRGQGTGNSPETKK